MSLFVACDAVARGLMSWGLKMPSKKAAAYNIPDLAVTYFVYHLIRNQLLQMRPQPGRSLIGAHVNIEIISALGARIVGITAGYFISRTLGYRVKPVAIVGLIAASTVGLCLGLRFLPNNPPPRGG
jgi:hypothetical protein